MLDKPQSHSPRWSHSTHFGRSVVPEVAKMQAGSSGPYSPAGLLALASRRAANSSSPPPPAAPSGQSAKRSAGTPSPSSSAAPSTDGCQSASFGAM